MDKYSSLGRMRYLIDILNCATKAYDEGTPIISDKQWDDFYFELEKQEKNSGIIYPDSPTQTINYQVVNNLEKVIHNHPMLSLPKTKDYQEFFRKFDEDKVFMLKMDGLTCSLTYENGQLVRAETRGDGEKGENILHNAKVLKSIPQTIPYKETLIVDGEVICRLSDFEAFSKDYKNPRNFAAGSIRLLDSQECSNRNLTFVAWDAFFTNHTEYSLIEVFNKLKTFGFTIVPYRHYQLIKENEFTDFIVDALKEDSYTESYPIDGLVVKVNDTIERNKYISTAHHLGGAFALKFYDEVAISHIINVEYQPSRNGVLTPVAIFEPVDMDGSTVSRASLHNISIWKNLTINPAVGDTVEVIKSNQIIPQIVKWQNNSGGPPISIPNTCPVCGGSTLIKEDGAAQILYCSNPNCDARFINQLDHFVGKKGLDIKGLSKATLEKLINWGWVSTKEDLFNLSKYRSDWIKKPGFGPKSVDNILAAIEEGRTVSLDKFICSLGITEIGSSVSKLIAKNVTSYEDFRNKVQSKWDFSIIDSIGGVMNDNILFYDYTEADYLAKYLNITNVQEDETQASMELNGKKIVITGSLNHFKNRAELKSAIEKLGGKVVGSISKTTNYLICNDATSGTGKVKEATNLNIPIISEEDFLKIMGN